MLLWYSLSHEKNKNQKQNIKNPFFEFMDLRNIVYFKFYKLNADLNDFSDEKM